jgi:hypothetical protein
MCKSICGISRNLFYNHLSIWIKSEIFFKKTIHTIGYNGLIFGAIQFSNLNNKNKNKEILEKKLKN